MNKKVVTYAVVFLMIVVLNWAAVFIARDIPTISVAAGLSAALVVAGVKAHYGDRQQAK